MRFEETFLGFYVSCDLIISNEEDFSFDFSHNYAFERYFQNKLFISEEEYNQYSSIQKISVVFNPFKRKCYFIQPNHLQTFLLKYFPEKKLIDKDHLCYFFLNPILSQEQNDRINITYNPIYLENYNELKINLFKYKSSIDEINKAQKVRNEKELVENQDISYLDMNKLIRPIYELSITEIEGYNKYYSEAEDKFFKEWQLGIEQEQDRLRDQYFDGMIDELYDDAYEIKREWNFDDGMNIDEPY